MRIVESFNEGWRFHKGDIKVNLPVDKGPVYGQSKTCRKMIGPAAYYYFDEPDCYGRDFEIKSEGWEKDISLPHDYVIDQDLNKQENNALGFVHYDNAWYRKHFSLEEYKDKRIVLEFGGIAGKSTIYLNGCLVKRNYSAYNSFCVDISDVAFFDKENVLAVFVDTSEPEGWWYQGGGIYRDVNLVVTDSISIDRYGVYAPYKKVDNENWAIDFEITVRNDSETEKEFSVKSLLLDNEGREVLSVNGQSKVDAFSKKTVVCSEIIKNPNLWDTKNPYLYTIKTLLSVDGEEIDEVYENMGFRTVEADANKGLLLNGKKVIIKGVCNHQDFGLTGLAVPDNIVKYKIKLIKDMGANGFRTSHYMNSKAVMDELDRQGMLVMDETRWFETTAEAKEQLKELILRDRNRPSVIIWSTGNEEPTVMSDVGYKIQRNLYNFIRKYDKTRLISHAVCHTPEKINFFDWCDIIGINYNLDSYEQVHKNYPDKLIISTECCATGTTRDWHYPSNNEGRIRDNDRDTNYWFLGREKSWRFLNSAPYIVGCYQWDSIEHRGESAWPAACSKSGAIDLFLQKKGAFYQNQSHWCEKPVVHIVPHWSFAGLEGYDIPVTVYTNCNELELFLNGESLGKQKIDKIGHGEWNVSYKEGELKAVGYNDGKEVASDVRVTSGKASRLVLTSEVPVSNSGKDIALVTCSCVDKNGNPVYDAEEFVDFTTNEDAFIVGTGSDTADSNNVKNNSRKMYMGKISVAVKPKKDIKKIVLYAHSQNCGYSVIEIDIKD